MKKNFLFLLLITTTFFAKAQYPLESGRLQFNLGTGYTNQGIPAYFGTDLGVAANLSIGVDASYRYYNESVGNTMFKHNIITFLGDINYHFNELLKLRNHTSADLYGGLSGGYVVANSPNLYPGMVETGVVFGGQFGYRIFLDEKYGFDIQIIGMSTFVGIKVGLSVLL